jgi:hypothetical protein
VNYDGVAVPVLRARQAPAVVPVVVRTQGVWCGCGRLLVRLVQLLLLVGAVVNASRFPGSHS